MESGKFIVLGWPKTLFHNIVQKNLNELPRQPKSVKGLGKFSFFMVFSQGTLLVFWFISHACCCIYYFVCIKFFIIKWEEKNNKIVLENTRSLCLFPFTHFSTFLCILDKGQMARVHAFKLQFKNKYLSSVKHWTKDLISSILSDDHRNKLVLGWYFCVPISHMRW